MPRHVPLLLAFYTKSDCPLCESARFALERARARLRDVPLVIEIRDIESDAVWFDTYRYRIPVIELDGDVLAEVRFDERTLKRRLRDAFRERVRDAPSPEIGH
jgi:hypothetical protein